MIDVTDDRQVQVLTNLLRDLFEVSAVYRHGERVSFALFPFYERKQSTKLLSDRLNLAGYKFDLTDQDKSILLSVDPTPVLKIPRLNLILFISTIVTIYLVPVTLKNLGGYGWDGLFDRVLFDLQSGVGIEFTLALVSILLVHEMGHFVAGKRRGLVTSWPYFIPAPNILGTFGAVIKSKSPFWNRRDLIEVGAAGPIAGWIVAMGWLIYGLTTSHILPAESFQITDMAFSMEGESIIMRFLTLSTIGTAGVGEYYLLSEAAFAGWAGLLLTAINMLPMGQLDGGHIVYGLLRKYQHILSKLTIAGLLLLGFQSPMWWIFAAMGFAFGIKHPPTLNDKRPLSKAAVTMGIISLIILFLSFTPIPFR